jgi:DNA-binding NarL/FixJ family response regulator
LQKAEAYTNKDIAKTLVISEHTVKDYVKDIYYTLAVHSRLELAALVNNYRLANKK